MRVGLVDRELEGGFAGGVDDLCVDMGKWEWVAVGIGLCWWELVGRMDVGDVWFI